MAKPESYIVSVSASARMNWRESVIILANIFLTVHREDIFAGTAASSADGDHNGAGCQQQVPTAWRKISLLALQDVYAFTAVPVQPAIY